MPFCFDEVLAPPLPDRLCTCVARSTCQACVNYEMNRTAKEGRKFGPKKSQETSSRIPLDGPKYLYIQSMVRKMSAWQQRNNRKGWLPSLHHLQGYEGLPCRKALHEHLGSSKAIYDLWLEHNLINEDRHRELVLYLTSRVDKNSFIPTFLDAVRAWQRKHGRHGDIPSISYFGDHAGLPTARTTLYRIGDAVDVYDLLYENGLLTKEVYTAKRNEAAKRASSARNGHEIRRKNGAIGGDGNAKKRARSTAV